MNRSVSAQLADQAGVTRDARIALDAANDDYQLASQMLLHTCVGCTSIIQKIAANRAVHGAPAEAAASPVALPPVRVSTAGRRARPFAPRSTAQFSVDRCTEDADLVAAFSSVISEGDAETEALLRGIQPFTARTRLGEKDQEWKINLWALPAQQTNGSPNKVALCMHGHGGECGVAVWGRFFGPLHAAGLLCPLLSIH